MFYKELYLQNDRYFDYRIAEISIAIFVDHVENSSAGMYQATDRCNKPSEWVVIEGRKIGVRRGSSAIKRLIHWLSVFQEKKGDSR